MIVFVQLTYCNCGTMPENSLLAGVAGFMGVSGVWGNILGGPPVNVEDRFDIGMA